MESKSALLVFAGIGIGYVVNTILSKLRRLEELEIKQRIEEKRTDFYSLLKEHAERRTNILMFGPQNSGKSSFINSIFAIVNRRWGVVCPASPNNWPKTLRIGSFQIPKTSIFIIDTPGFTPELDILEEYEKKKNLSIRVLQE